MEKGGTPTSGSLCGPGYEPVSSQIHGNRRRSFAITEALRNKALIPSFEKVNGGLSVSVPVFRQTPVLGSERKEYYNYEKKSFGIIYIGSTPYEYDSVCGWGRI